MKVKARHTRPTVAIIGAGFSGSLVALHLLAAGTDAPRVLLVERARGFGKGVAYGTRHGAHLLNVRAGNMSGFPDQPSHFVEWLRNQNDIPNPVDAGGFVPRTTYGRYLQDMLAKAATGNDAVGRLVLVADDAISLAPRGDSQGFTLVSGVGRSYPVDGVVLAVGNFPPDPPPGVDRALLKSFRFQTDPWGTGALDRIKEEDPVLLLGTSLTMVDVAISLTDRGHRGPILALSRRGLLPRRHADAGHPPPPSPPTIGPSLSQSLHAVRQAVRDADFHWHGVIDSLRGGTAAYWQAMPTATRARFIRHLRPWWDVHRHRLAPAIDAQVQTMMRSGRLSVLAGRIERLQADPEGLRLRYRPRGGTGAQEKIVSHAINCVGPGGDIAGTTDPLLRGLLDQGLVRPDPLRLGLDTDADARIRRADGTIIDGFYAMGPIMKGTLWEITAVPDIRIQAKRLAGTILDRLQGLNNRESEGSAANRSQ